MKKIIDNIKNFFNFSKPERRGTIVLLIIIFLLLFIRLFVINVFQKTSKLDIIEFTADVEKFFSDIDSLKADNLSKENFDFNNPDKSFAIAKLKPFPFNPNEMTTELWKKLGLRDKQISVIQNYMSKGGKFYNKGDFKKMYCIRPEEYSVLEPYIVIPKYNKIDTFKNNFAVNKKLIFELNSSDTLDLQEVSGIGPAFARRIIKYREMLGGFIKKEQLLEVFGMDSARYNQIVLQLSVDSKNIKKIDINNTTLQELKKHPYFGYYVAKSIIMYREKYGNFKSPADLKKVPLIYDDVYEKISPYLIVN